MTSDSVCDPPKPSIGLASTKRPRIAFGPELPGFGSWEWIGLEMAESLKGRFETVTFREDVPQCDVVVFVKFCPELAELRQVTSRARVLFCPVDRYGSGAEIDADEPFLSRCQRIVVHCHRLARWFLPYAPVDYLDHHVRFAAPFRTDFRTEGPLLWVGARSNLAPIVDWVNRAATPEEIWVLTNPESNDEAALKPEQFGFQCGRRVRIGRWTPDRHREWTVLARAAFDVKGDDFRQRHKPPVKAIDFLASGVPFATNSGSSPAEHLAELGFGVASPDDSERWLSREYFEQSIRFGQTLAQDLGRERVAGRWAELLDSLLAEPPRSRKRTMSVISETNDVSSSPQQERTDSGHLAPTSSRGSSSRRTKVAILSLLFNWPSTGGGTIHTYEAAKFLSRAGYEVKHFYARYDGWGVGGVASALASPSQELTFDETTWNEETIRDRFREAIDVFSPDAVILTDSWNTKPLLAEAVAGYRYYLRLAALECLCPLNNVRLLVGSDGRTAACPRQQLESPHVCRECVTRNGRLSGALHQADRTLAGFDRRDYARRLGDAFAGAEGVLAVNPAIADMVRPYSRAAYVVPSGFDPDRFAQDQLESNPPPIDRGRFTLLFAGLTHEYMKGFSVLEEAAERLWAVRQDFEVLATGDPPGRQNDFLRFIGWQSQDDLPRWIRAADALVFPTLAEEALGRSAVEAMACSRPVVASRIGGLPYTVRDGETGLLVEPGNSVDLADKIARLLDDADLRRRLGEAGRRRFEQEFTWDVVLERHYRPLFGDPAQTH